MIEKILIEINRLKNELDGYSAREGLDYIESYINTLSKQDMGTYDKIKKVLALGFMRFLDDNKSKGKMCLSNGECADIEKAFNEQDWPRLAGYLDKYTESEDERIRKSIVATIEQCPDDFLNPKNRDKMLAYLEKQKEQKSLSISAASEWLREHVCHYVNSEYNEFHKCVEYDGSIDKERLINDFEEAMQKEQKPAEWSEEDEAMLDSVIRIITRFDDLAHEPTFAGPKWTHPYTKELNFLEKLRNRLFEEND